MDRLIIGWTDGWTRGFFSPFYRTLFLIGAAALKRRDGPTDGLMDRPTDVAMNGAMGGQSYAVTVITYD